jgi:hypothetical protein
MAVKFLRNYSLDIGTQDGDTITVTPPFTVEFEILRNTLSKSGTLHIRIYNLSAKHRNQIRYNFYNTGELRPVTLNAGYGSGILPEVFTGNIQEAYSVREGNNFVTTIEAFDGGFAQANGTTDTSFPAGTPQRTVISTLAASLSQYGISLGSIGAYPGSISRGNSYSGNTCQILNELTNGGFFIDGGVAHCLGTNECTTGGIQVINAQTGLLNTPVQQQTVITFDMLFEPSVIAAQQIELESSTDLNVNGIYKVTSIKHRVTISDAVCGDAVTSLEMFYGTAALAIVGDF